MPPETRFTCSGNVRIACRIAGEGPLDLVYAPGREERIDDLRADEVIQ